MKFDPSVMAFLKEETSKYQREYREAKDPVLRHDAMTAIATLVILMSDYLDKTRDPGAN